MNLNRQLLRFFLFLVLLAWCTGFSLKILFADSGIAVFNPVINLFYDNVCHQNENKIISINGFYFFICARCTGIYLGALLISLTAILYFKKIKAVNKILLVSVIILVSDVVYNNFITVDYNKTTAFITGIFAGSFIYLTILNLLEKSFINEKQG